MENASSGEVTAVQRTSPKSICPDPAPLAYRVNDAAKVAGRSRSSIYNLIRDGHLTAVKVAGVRLVRRDELLSLLGIRGT
jgi:excisionase family DNA binding protein